MANLGRAVSIIVKFERQCHEQFDDLEAYYAPSECYRDVERGQRRRFRLVRRRACHAAGVKNLRQLRKACIKAVPTWDRYCHFRLGLDMI